MFKKQLELEYFYKDRAEVKVADDEELITARVENSLLANFTSYLSNVLVTEPAKKNGAVPTYYYFLQKGLDILGDDVFIVLASFTLQRILKAQSKLSTVAFWIGNTFEQELRVTVEDNPYLERGINRKHSTDRRTQYARRWLGSNAQEQSDFIFQREEVIALGGACARYCVECFPMFFRQEPRDSTIYYTDLLVDKCRNLSSRIQEMAYAYPPTIIPPKDWVALDDGGYYGRLHGQQFIRFKHDFKRTKNYNDYITNLPNIDNIYKAINKLQRTAYQINHEVLELVTLMVNNNTTFGVIPENDPELPLTPLPPEHTQEELRVYKSLRKAQIQRENVRRGRLIRMFCILREAKFFKDYERIYIPHSIDFRGRVYAIPIFNPQGDDLTKSLFLYVDVPPLVNEDDFKYFLIQGANLFGNDKIAFEERVSFIQDLTVEALEDLWKTADKPFQFYAWLMEYKKALTYKEKHGTLKGWECLVPINVDGTCSGLQHYSALLRDEVGGNAVNLIDRDLPADIYAVVADKVIEYVKEGAVEEPYVSMLWINYGITRKVVKRCVMTYPYGSRTYGFRQQILDDITKDNPHFKGFEFAAAGFIAPMIWKAVTQTVIKASEGMEFLKELTRVVCRHTGETFTWVSPIGLAITQPYLQYETKVIRVKLSKDIRIKLYMSKIKEPQIMNPRKNKQGIAPNFIHGLDASHLLLTILASDLSNYTVIHDSFGTTLTEISTLSKILRETFVSMYENARPLETLVNKARQLGVPEELIPKLPDYGDLDIKEVLSSKYMFH